MRFDGAGIRHGRLDDPADGDLYRIGIENHFCLVVDRVHAKTKLSRAALWRLVGDAIAQRFLDAGQRFDAIEAANASAIRILKTPASPLSDRELHYFNLTQYDRHERQSEKRSANALVAAVFIWSKAAPIVPPAC